MRQSANIFRMIPRVGAVFDASFWKVRMGNSRYLLETPLLLLIWECFVVISLFRFHSLLCKKLKHISYIIQSKGFWPVKFIYCSIVMIITSWCLSSILQRLYKIKRLRIQNIQIRSFCRLVKQIHFLCPASTAGYNMLVSQITMRNRNVLFQK